MNTAFKIPLYAKVSQILLGIFILFFILYIGQAIVIPILFSFIIAILLNPAVNYLYRRKVIRIEPLKPFGFLISNNMSSNEKKFLHFPKKKVKANNS